MAIGDHFYTTSDAEKENALAQYGYVDEGVACAVFNFQARGTVPLLRLFNPTSNDHFYTTSQAEAATAVAASGYQDEGTACFVYAAAGVGRIPLFRLFNSGNGDHFYTTSQAEAANAVAAAGYTAEGTACFVPATSARGTTPLLRLFKVGDITAAVVLNLKLLTGPTIPISTMLRQMRRVYASAGIRVDVRPFEAYTSEGTACFVLPAQAGTSVPLHRLFGGTDHFYTTSTVERDNAVTNFGYTSEGVACFVFDFQAPGTVPLHRLLHPANGDHFYTTSVLERDEAIAQFGYASEGIACFVFENSAGNTTPFLRLFNPTLGDHFYTTSSVEAETATLVEFLDLPLLTDLDTGPCVAGTMTTELTQLYSNRNNVQSNEVVVFFVRSTNGSAGPLNGCAASPAASPGCVVTQIAGQWTLAHEVGHVLGLAHVATEASTTSGSCLIPAFVPTRLMTGCGTNRIGGTPTIVASEITTMMNSPLTN